MDNTTYMSWCDATAEEKRLYCSKHKDCSTCPYFDQGGVIND